MWELFTKREQEVAEGLCYGFCDKEIAQCLNITVRTVKAHVKRIALRCGIPHDPAKHLRIVLAVGLVRELAQTNPAAYAAAARYYRSSACKERDFCVSPEYVQHRPRLHSPASVCERRAS